MKLRKFSANTSREAIRLVRDALGSDAIILSNKNIDGRVEIVAMEEDAVNALASENAESCVSPAPEHIMQAMPQFSPKIGVLQETESFSQQWQTPQPAIVPSNAMDMANMMNEIRSMRGMLEAQLAEIAWGHTQKRHPQKAKILKEMLATGFSASLARFLIEKLPLGESNSNQEAKIDGLDWIKAILVKNLQTIGNENEILEKGGVYALVGPTGVGKTTTTAKLAARCVMRHGPSKLALISTDGYRIGGYEQLRIYGKILGVMVHAVKDEADLRIALSELKNKHTVLIDTVGVGQRDKMVTEQVAMLSGADVNVKRLLCLNATSTGETLSEVVRAYQGNGLAGCILTKLDEAATIGGALDIAIRQKLRIYYVASGQRVPEDLHVANKHYLIDRAFKLKRETSAFRFLDDELPSLIANTFSNTNHSNAREVSFG
jgi:flagellar biosynthesis protein FlhF